MDCKNSRSSKIILTANQLSEEHSLVAVKIIPTVEIIILKE